MSGIWCDECGGKLIEEMNGSLHCDTCGYIKHLDGHIEHGVGFEEEVSLCSDKVRIGQMKN